MSSKSSWTDGFEQFFWNLFQKQGFTYSYLFDWNMPMPLPMMKQTHKNELNSTTKINSKMSMTQHNSSGNIISVLYLSLKI